MLKRPILRVDPKQLPTAISPAPPELDYSHSSVFRSTQLEIHVRSPSVKIHRTATYDIRSVPVFGDHDKVIGQVLLDVGLCSTPGRLTISLQGSFLYVSPTVNQPDLDDYVDLSRKEKQRHIFFLSSETRNTGEIDSPRSTTSLRDAFAASVRVRRAERRPTHTSVYGALRPYAFLFDIPRPQQSGQELPPTFSSVAEGEGGPRNRPCVERVEVSYSVKAIWEAADGSDRILVEAPVMYEPDPDFQSFDGMAMQTESWLEIPLKSDRPLPMTCAVTLPHPANFSRSSSVSYFVVFTTTPRSTNMAREIASDATISVSLLRDVRIDAITPRYSHPSSSTPSTSSDESDMPPVASRRLLQRVVRGAPGTGRREREPSLTRGSSHSSSRQEPSRTRWGSRSSEADSRDKPLPQVPSPGIADTRVLHADMSVGFPKRPRYRCEPNQKHPSLEVYKSLPDGLYKGKIQFDKNMLPAFDWAGLRVKYYLEVSVIFGQDQMRARVPLRIS